MPLIYVNCAETFTEREAALLLLKVKKLTADFMGQSNGIHKIRRCQQQQSCISLSENLELCELWM